MTSEQLRAHLAVRLPDYLVPARFVLLDQLPLTAAGKLDLARLPDPARQAPAPEAAGTPAPTPTERLVASVWRQVLGVDQISGQDDFFALGGDSIAVLDVFARLEAHFPCLPAPTVLYRHRTLAGLAAALSEVDAEGAAPRRRRLADGEFPLSPAQRGFLLAEALSPRARTSWLACFRLTGPLDPAAFQRAVDRLVERHPMLRTVILAGKRPVVQEVQAAAELPVQFDAIEAGELPQRLAEERGHRFDPAAWPLIRLQVLRVGQLEHAFVVHAHHLVGDGYSVVVLAQDLLALYDEVVDGAAGTLTPLRSTFRDYVELILAGAGRPGPSPAPPPDPGPAYVPPVLRRPGPDGPDHGSAGFTLDPPTTAALRERTRAAGTTPYAVVLTAYYRSLARLTGQPDLLLGVAVTGRDHALADLHRMVGPLATVVPVRVRDPGWTLAAQLSSVAAAVREARASDSTIQQRLHDAAGSAPVSSFGAQFVFSYLDFDALGPIAGERLRLTWEDGAPEIEPPQVGTDLLLTARPIDDSLRVTVRASAGVLPTADLEAFAAGLRRELTDAAELPGTTHAAAPRSGASGTGGTPTRRLDAALIGYLPAPHHLAAQVAIPASDGLREAVRSALFPDGRPRLLEELSTPLGRSGFICLPTFADELAPTAGGPLGREVAHAVRVASDFGARAVSLAGMIPAHTAYGFDVVADLDPAAPRVTTGHAATAASMVKTTLRALGEAGSDLSERTVTVVGLGSIGSSSLDLLLALELGIPQRVLLCDVAGRAQHLSELAAALRNRGCSAEFAVCGPDLHLPVRAYQADLILAAISADRTVLDIDRLRPGTIVVDDSFPHCFDTASATRRMADQGDVVVLGGGLLTAGPSRRTTSDDPVLRPYATHLAGLRIPDTIPSCQLESLMLATRPDLPPVRGLADVALALTYWKALAALGVDAAPLHLGQQLVTVDLPR